MLYCQENTTFGVTMGLWLLWWANVKTLQAAFSRKRTFLWFALCVAGITVRKDLAGVSSIMRSLGLKDKYYDRLLDCFHSSAINLDVLTVLWVKLIRLCCKPFLLIVNDRVVILGDGIKAPSRIRLKHKTRIHLWSFVPSRCSCCRIFGNFFCYSSGVPHT